MTDELTREERADKSDDARATTSDASLTLGTRLLSNEVAADAGAEDEEEEDAAAGRRTEAASRSEAGLTRS